MLAGPSQMPSLRTVIALRLKPRIENDIATGIFADTRQTLPHLIFLHCDGSESSSIFI